tara:strand:+ start:327 stop:773 length:447 start_codon:yes stop_codon:yes gene_type:complete
MKEIVNSITGIRKLKKTDRRTFSSYERRILSDYSAFIERIWCEPGQKLVRSYGQSDEGESWFVLSKDTVDGVFTVCSMSIEAVASDGDLKNYRHWCGARHLDFMEDDLVSLIKLSSADGIFEKFMEYHKSTTNYDEGRDNVIQLISAS